LSGSKNYLKRGQHNYLSGIAQLADQTVANTQHGLVGSESTQTRI
jgi:hypothetical protein